MKISARFWRVCACVLCFIIGVGVGYIIAVCAGDNAYSADLLCYDGTAPDKNGCCTGETYTDMGDLGFNCCPDNGGDCFPPIR